MRALQVITPTGPSGLEVREVAEDAETKTALGRIVR